MLLQTAWSFRFGFEILSYRVVPNKITKTNFNSWYRYTFVTSEKGETHVTYEEFSKVHLKIGKVIHAERIQGMKKVFKVVVDIGDERRDLAVGAAPYFSPEQFVGRIVVVCTNLEPRRIGNLTSNGMLLAAEGPDGRPAFLTIRDDVPLGSAVR
jgi:methionine--tRNA ligase beta chain